MRYGHSGAELEGKKGSVKSLRYLIKYLKPYRYMIGGMLIALIVTSSSVLLIGKSLQLVIDLGIAQNDPKMLDKGLIGLIGIIILLALATFARFFLITYVGEKVVADVRRDIYDHILALSPSFYEVNKAGEILSRLTTDTTLLQMVVGSSLSVAMRNVIMLIGGITMLILASAKLSLLIAIVIPLVVLPIIYFGRKMRKYSKLSQDKVADLSAISEETINAIKTIQAYAKEDYERSIFRRKVEESIQTAWRRILIRSTLTAIVITTVFGSIGVILWIGGHDVLKGSITPGELSSFIFLSVVCAGAFGAIADVIGDLQKAGGATERLVEFLNTQPDIKDPLDPKQLAKNVKGNIAFNQVTFYYPSRPDRAALKDVSFEILPGKLTAIVGESGAGKSTIFQLLLRFYDTQAGAITFDKVDITQLKLSNLRSQFGVVSQDPVVFSATAYENILYGNPNASQEEVYAAAKAASALEFIEKLPQGFQSFLGEKGTRLSGGQRQRIAIARAILKNPKVLLLDEATSALDTRNEKVVQEALEKLMQDRTTIVIAHRLSTVINAYNILVFDKGQIVEQGAHAELMSKKAVYYNLVNLQLKEGKWK
jgi:ATP-binding cassette subfamily B protein